MYEIDKDKYLDPKIVAKFWIQREEETREEKELDITGWLSSLIYNIFWNTEHADYAFEIIDAIHELDKDQKHVETFSASLVEDILVHKGYSVIEKIENKAKQDRSFANVLGGVWKSKISEEIWERVQNARDTSIWADSQQ